MKLKLFFLLLIFPFLTSFGQKQGNVWYFGDHAGIDFNNGFPVALTNGQTNLANDNMGEGTAVICDNLGHLLFYTNGSKIWNKNQQVMINGDSLLSNFSSTQSSLIIPLPGSDHLFYLFTTDDFDIDSLKYGFRYSIIDMCLDNGLGGVVSGKKNILILDTVAEKLTAVRHTNGIDYWVIVHKYYSDAFYAYRFTANGIIDTVITHIGSIHNAPSPNPTKAAIGYMKASPNGGKIALVSLNRADNIKELFDFNNSLGVVSNYVDLDIQVDTFGGYGLSFSPDNSKLYYTTTSNVYQYDLNAGGGNPNSIRSSKTQISFLTNDNAEALQRGPDEKIYVARANKTFLAVINNPNQQGLNCNFQDSAVTLNGKMCNMGLPNLIDSYFYSNTTVDCTTGIDELNNKSLSIKIYPNPAQQFFNIELPKEQNFSILVYDMTGQKVYENQNATGVVKGDCSNFSNGIYFVQAVNATTILSCKLIKE